VSLVEIRIFKFYNEEELLIVSIGPCSEIVQYVSSVEES